MQIKSLPTLACALLLSAVSQVRADEDPMNAALQLLTLSSTPTAVHSIGGFTFTGFKAVRVENFFPNDPSAKNVLMVDPLIGGTITGPEGTKLESMNVVLCEKTIGSKCKTMAVVADISDGSKPQRRQRSRLDGRDLGSNVIQVPIHIPVNVCGNAISVIGLLNPAFGNTCQNFRVRKRSELNLDTGNIGGLYIELNISIQVVII
ncbi:hypothetical protein ABW20_dc0107887 [Dactylellina cionopaga]|nr:hypothetical protein ABW20_dc0107887 [Dactylellina cionopaga]